MRTLTTFAGLTVSLLWASALGAQDLGALVETPPPEDLQAQYSSLKCSRGSPGAANVSERLPEPSEIGRIVAM